MNQEKKVSIIMPAYNASLTIERAIETIVEQSYSNWELLVIDDGSTDSTVEVVRRFNDARILCFSQNNAGPARARNNGLDKASGEYILFVDSDDAIHCRYIEELLWLIENEHADVAMCSYVKICDKDYSKIIVGNTKKNEYMNCELPLVLSPDEAIDCMFYKKLVMPYPFLKMFRRETVGGIRFPEQYKLGEDLEFNFNVFKKCRKIIYTSKVLYYHINNDKSITHTLNYDVVYAHYLQMLNFYRTEERYKKSIENRIFVEAYDILSQADSNLIKNKEYFNLCRQFIKQHRMSVLRDDNSKTMVKMMAFLSFFSIRITTLVCKLGKKVNLKSAL